MKGPRELLSDHVKYLTQQRRSEEAVAFKSALAEDRSHLRRDLLKKMQEHRIDLRESKVVDTICPALLQPTEVLACLQKAVAIDVEAAQSAVQEQAVNIQMAISLLGKVIEDQKEVQALQWEAVANFQLLDLDYKANLQRTAKALEKARQQWEQLKMLEGLGETVDEAAAEEQAVRLADSCYETFPLWKANRTAALAAPSLAVPDPAQKRKSVPEEIHEEVPELWQKIQKQLRRLLHMSSQACFLRIYDVSADVVATDE